MELLNCLQLGAEDCGSAMAGMRDTARRIRRIGAREHNHWSVVGDGLVVSDAATSWAQDEDQRDGERKTADNPKRFQEVLRWLRRNRATLRRKYYSSSNAKSQNDSFDNVLRYLTAIDEGDYWKSPSPDSEGTEIRLRDLLDSFNDRRAGRTIINVFTEFKVEVILEHASREVGLERMIEFVSHGKNKPEKQKEKKQGPDEPFFAGSLSIFGANPSYSEIIYSDYRILHPNSSRKTSAGRFCGAGPSTARMTAIWSSSAPRACPMNWESILIMSS